MQHLFTPEGEAALAALMARRPLLAFDFDGTLAPIVARPDDARVPAAVAARLERPWRRACRWRSSRAARVADVRGRLGFAPRFVVGNHGAEDPRSGRCQPRMPLPRWLARAAAARTADLHAAGVLVEDKGQSIALHYRLAPERGRRARADLRRAAAAAPESCRSSAARWS